MRSTWFRRSRSCDRARGRRRSGWISTSLLVTVAALSGCGSASSHHTPKPAAQTRTSSRPPIQAPSAPTTAKSGRITIDTSGQPIKVADLAGHIWVLANSPGALYELDPTTARVMRTVDLGNDSCGMAPSAGQLWTTECSGDWTRQVAPQTGKVRRVPGASDTVLAGSLWAMHGHDLVRTNLRTGRVQHRFRNLFSDPDHSEISAAADGSVWLGLPTSIVRVNTTTDRSTVVQLPGATPVPSVDQGYALGANIVFAGGLGWYANPSGVYGFDVRTDRAHRVPGVRIGALDTWGDITLAAGAASVWVRSSGDEVTRIDARTLRVVGHYPATGGGGGLAVVGHSLWVTNAGDNSTWREPIR